jgi:hypothetical protein
MRALRLMQNHLTPPTRAPTNLHPPVHPTPHLAADVIAKSATALPVPGGLYRKLRSRLGMNMAKQTCGGVGSGGLRLTFKEVDVRRRATGADQAEGLARGRTPARILLVGECGKRD